MVCFQIYRELLLLATFFRVHLNPIEICYLYGQNKYSILKVTCHIKLKCFLWTKLLHSALLAKCLITVSATLIKNFILLKQSHLHCVLSVISTTKHLFAYFIFCMWPFKCLWSDLVECFQNILSLPTLPPQTVIFGILDSANNDFILKNNKVFINHILLIFKLHMQKVREKKFINLHNLIAKIRNVKRIEKEIVLTNSMETIAFT